MPGPTIARNGVLLALIALSTTALIAGTYRLTKDTIALQMRQAQELTLLQIVPRSRHDNAMLDDTITVGPQAAGLGLRDEQPIYIARRNGQVVAVIIPVVAHDGYAGDIDLRVGVNSDGTVAGVRVLAHRETPGLGDRMELKHSNWLLDFAGRSLTNPALEGWAVQQDGGVFDQFTGATITPRAVVAATRRALQFAEANSENLFRKRDTVHSGGAP